MGNSNDVIVYIVSNLESRYLKQTIESVACQAEARLVEIVVVLNTRRTVAPRALRKQLQATERQYLTPIRTIFEPTPGIPFARNRALLDFAESGADWLAFIDDDCIAEPGWLTALLNTAQSANVPAAASRWRLSPDGAVSPLIPPETWDDRTYRINGRPAEQGSLLRHAYTRSVLFRPVKTEILRGTLSFDETRVESGGSDVLFFEEFRKHVGPIVFVSEAGVVEKFAGRRLGYRWHFNRKQRNTQFLIERSRRGETIYLPRNVPSLAIYGLLSLAGASVSCYAEPRRPLRIPRPRLYWLGIAGFYWAQALAVLKLVFGVEVTSYRAVFPADEQPNPSVHSPS